MKKALSAGRSTTIMIIARRKINTVDARAIISCGIGARNRRNTKIRGMLMIVDTIRT
jgi:hypothetical protein